MEARGQLGPPCSSEIWGNLALVSQFHSVRKPKAIAEVSADLWGFGSHDDLTLSPVLPPL